MPANELKYHHASLNISVLAFCILLKKSIGKATIEYKKYHFKSQATDIHFFH